VQLALHAWAFEPLGFVLSPFLFCLGLSLMLGAAPLPAVAFAAITGVLCYVVAAGPLDLNLPAGVLDMLE
jgi:putative tricarboxylic transport membrane protein